VTIDALGCQKEIAQQIVDRGGDYVLAVEDNQPHLLEDIQGCLAAALDGGGPGCDTDTTEERGHGRHEMRSYVVVVDPPGIRNRAAWAELRVVGMCWRERVVGGVPSEEVHYFVGSRVMNGRRYGVALRGHWGIENNLHWQLDVTFAEDNSRVQRRHGAENLALIRRLALGLLKQHPSTASVACKRLTAGLDTAFLEEVLLPGGNSAKV
jgi:predicted transposase YbfD/YdcC